MKKDSIKKKFPKGVRKEIKGAVTSKKPSKGIY